MSEAESQEKKAKLSKCAIASLIFGGISFAGLLL